MNYAPNQRALTYAPRRLIDSQMNLHADPTSPLDAAARTRPLAIPARPRPVDAIDSAGCVRLPVPHSTSDASVLGWHHGLHRIPVPSRASATTLGP